MESAIAGFVGVESVIARFVGVVLTASKEDKQVLHGYPGDSRIGFQIRRMVMWLLAISTDHGVFLRRAACGTRRVSERVE